MCDQWSVPTSELWPLINSSALYSFQFELTIELCLGNGKPASTSVCADTVDNMLLYVSLLVAVTVQSVGPAA